MTDGNANTTDTTSSATPALAICHERVEELQRKVAALKTENEVLKEQRDKARNELSGWKCGHDAIAKDLAATRRERDVLTESLGELREKLDRVMKERDEAQADVERLKSELDDLQHRPSVELTKVLDEKLQHLAEIFSADIGLDLDEARRYVEVAVVTQGINAITRGTPDPKAPPATRDEQ